MTQTASSAGAVVTGTTTNSAASLEADYSSAATITMSESNNDVTIKEAGTYIITGTCSDGNIKVKKGTTGVVLVLKDLDLTSTVGATLSINKGAEAKIIISGSVKLTDAEDPTDENSADADVADAFGGAAIKVKSGASAYITGTGTLTVNGSAKNGVKVSASEDDGNGSLVIDGASITINAANDAINAEYDLAFLGGTLTITAGDDALHADRVLTVGENGSGPSITIKSCTEGVEATVVNLAGGTVNVTSTDDGVNAPNSD
ncbi:MAG: carbohydrate-binding domain-containing protein, partial [Oscillospiraceae bacterium]|nr:carbohydrate-binding domain-containing protein [Oscillospiraceae bacterium]